MNDDELKSLLRRADVGYDLPIVRSEEVVERVRRLDRRRRTRARVLSAAAPVLLVAIVAAWLLVPRAEQAEPSVAAVLAEIEQLRAEAKFHEQAARELVALAEWERSYISPSSAALAADPIEEIREQVDVVAYRMVLRADGLHAQMMGSAEAVELYREVLRLFPKTYSAEVAKERLAGLGASVEET